MAAHEGEVATALTDALLAVQSAFYVGRLGRAANRREQSARCWRGAFVAAGIAAAAGSAHHALPRQTLPGLRRGLWKGVGVATGAAGLLLLAGGILANMGGAWRRFWLGVALVKSVLLGVNSWRKNDFRYLIYDYGSSMAALLVLQGQRRTPAAPAICWGVLISFLAAAMQQKGPVLHPRFDRNALYHLIQMGAFHFFAQAGKRLRDAP